MLPTFLFKTNKSFVTIVSVLYSIFVHLNYSKRLIIFLLSLTRLLATLACKVYCTVYSVHCTVSSSSLISSFISSRMFSHHSIFCSLYQKMSVNLKVLVLSWTNQLLEYLHSLPLCTVHSSSSYIFRWRYRVKRFSSFWYL